MILTAVYTIIYMWTHDEIINMCNMVVLELDKKILRDCPQVLRDFLFYMETIKGRSPATVNSYYIDLRNFFRFIKELRGMIPKEIDFKDIVIEDITIDLIRTITLSDVYEYLNYTLSERSNSAKTRARKVSCLRSFFNYLTSKAHLLEENPVKDLETPKLKKSLPKYLSLEQSLELLNHVEGEYQERDYCILTLFLNCGMRLSELVGINLSDIQDNTLRLTGKGNKERIVYLNEACLTAIESYLSVRTQNVSHIKDKNALFLSRLGKRIDKRRVQQIVSKHLQDAGLGNMGYSTHKLRHTAATLMYQHGNVDIRVLKEILGHVNLGTTEIYTHVTSSQLEKASDASPLSGIKKKTKSGKKSSQDED